MKKFIINISYSWGDEEEPVEFEAESEYDAFMYMIDLAATEAKVSMELDNDLSEISPTNIRIYPSDRKITLHYGYDDEECYYELEEASNINDDLLDDLLMEQREQM